MRITRYTDYALRVLIYLGLKGEDLVTIREIAERYGISRTHLMKVVQELSGAGYVLATPGRGGGLRLNRPSEEINVGSLVRRLEQDSALVDCFTRDGNCVISPACQLKHALNHALEAFFAVLDGYTLADLLPQRRQSDLIRLLQIADFTDVTGESSSKH